MSINVLHWLGNFRMDIWGWQWWIYTLKFFFVRMEQHYHDHRLHCFHDTSQLRAWQRISTSVSGLTFRRRSNSEVFRADCQTKIGWPSADGSYIFCVGKETFAEEREKERSYLRCRFKVNEHQTQKKQHQT